MTEHGRLGISGPVVIEKWMGKQAYDSADRALVWKTSGGKTKYLFDDADVLADDDAGSVRLAIGKLLAKFRPLNLKAVQARQAQLERRLRRFGKTTDPDEIWTALGVDDVARASLAKASEFVAGARKKSGRR